MTGLSTAIYILLARSAENVDINIPAPRPDPFASIGDAPARGSTLPLAAPVTAPASDCLADDDQPRSGAELSRALRGGLGSLTVENGTTDDAVVTLVNGYTARAARRVFVRAGERGLISSIPVGSYRARFALGSSYSRDSRRFCSVVGASEYDADMVFDEIQDADGVRYSIQRLTLHRVRGGNAPAHSIDPSLVFDDPPTL